MADDPALADDLDVQRQALLDLVPALDHRIDGRLEILRFGLGKEADVAQIHAEQRHLRGTGQLGRPQERTVAAEDHRDLSTGGGIVDLDDLDLVEQVGILGLALLHADLEAGLDQA